MFCARCRVLWQGKSPYFLKNTRFSVGVLERNPTYVEGENQYVLLMLKCLS